MQQFYCECSQRVMSHHMQCFNCGRVLGFDPLLLRMYFVTPSDDGLYRDAAGIAYRLCPNRVEFHVCNGLVEDAVGLPPQARCSGCRLNRTIPNVGRLENILRWRRLEVAKRRMLAGVAGLGLFVGKVENGFSGGMRFDFIEDKRSHPEVDLHFVTTGHHDGLITVNVLEAEAVERMEQQELMGESYRTLLGHFRHEAGHYFYPQLVTDIASFTQQFGDPGADYGAAVDSYYKHGAPANWNQRYISAYAASHPMEDWAECFAHLLHIRDAMETAVAYGLFPFPEVATDITGMLEQWSGLIAGINEMNQSLGCGEPYPFVLSQAVKDKLAYVQGTIDRDVASRS